MTSRALPIILHPSRRKLLWLMAACLAFILASVWDFDKNPAGYGFMIVFCVLFIAGAGVTLHPRAAYLKLTERGFEYCVLFRPHFVAWAGVAGFTSVKVSRLDVVGWSYAPNNPRATTMQRISNAIAGAGMALPSTYGLSSDELARLMNDMLRKYGGDASKKPAR